MANQAAVKVFIDGSAGTTGLRIRERLQARPDLTLLTLPEERRKDPAARSEMLNSCDIAFLCLPDDAAREAVSMITNPNVTVLDTSTAHRTDPAWAYGFPELSPAHEAAVRTSRRIAVPGCHASGFIALIYPLIKEGILPKDTFLSATSLTGYSGGGKKMIAQYEDPQRPHSYSSPRQYGLSQMHKHLPEMKAVTGLETSPAFLPIVADFYSGMEVTIPLHTDQADAIREIYQKLYQGPLVTFSEEAPADGFAAANAMSGSDAMKIQVYGNSERVLLMALFDNLGKGASGAAIECMNLSLGLAPETGLVL